MYTASKSTIAPEPVHIGAPHK